MFEECQKIFVDQAGLNSHKYLVHKEAAKLFYCSTCSKTFNTKRKFDQHTSKNHKNIKCLQCEKVYKSKVALNHHIKEKHQQDDILNAEFLIGQESQDMFEDIQEDVLGDI